MEREPTITCIGDDGVTVMKYFLVCDPHLRSEDIGWVLVVEGPEPLEPQYVTPTEVVGDLRSMGLSEDDIMVFLLRSGTEEMLEQLHARPDAREASSATATVILELERELEQLPHFDLS